MSGKANSLRPPRRTAELDDASSSTKKPRVSRIAVRCPAPRDRSIERASSVDRASNMAYLTSTKKPQRSTSATPMRTPNRPIPYHGNNIQLTTEKLDKKLIFTQASKINDYLKVIDITLGKDFVQRGGVKSMSTKEFIIIINHLLTFIVGNRFKISTNYVDDIVNVLSQIHYPYSINKSWLKTPSAPHSFHHIVTLLTWLLAFVPPTEGIEQFEADKLIADQEFPDKEYKLKFMKINKEGFSLWNDNKDEDFRNLEQNLADFFIEKRTSVKNLVIVQQNIETINKNIEELTSKKVVFKREDEFFELDKEIKMKNKQLLKLKENCKEKSDELGRVKNMSDNKMKLIKDVETRNSELYDAVKAQLMSVKDRDNLIEEVNHLKHELKSKRDLVFKLQTMGSNNQVIRSRLMTNKIDLISKFNNYLYEIFTDGANLKKIDISAYCLDQKSGDDLIEQVNRVIPILNKIKQDSSEQIQNYTKSITDLEYKYKLALYEHNTVLESKLVDIMNRYKNLVEQVQEVDIKIIRATEKSSKEMERLTMDIKHSHFANQKLELEIDNKKKKFTNIEQENKIMFEKICSKTESILDEKEKRLARVDEAVKNFETYLEETQLKFKDS